MIMDEARCFVVTEFNAGEDAKHFRYCSSRHKAYIQISQRGSVASLMFDCISKEGPGRWYGSNLNDEGHAAVVELFEDYCQKTSYFVGNIHGYMPDRFYNTRKKNNKYIPIDTAIEVAKELFILLNDDSLFIKDQDIPARNIS